MQISVKDLISVLEKFGSKYEAVDVFADDVVDLVDLIHHRQTSLLPLDIDGRSFLVQVQAQKYRLEVFPREGVARLTKWQGAPPNTASSEDFVGSLVHEAAKSAKDKKGANWSGGLILGLLVGASLGANGNSPEAPHRVFALMFDPEMEEWRPYDGGLLRWMKQRLVVPQTAYPS